MNDKPLLGKTAIVTGGSGGIGRYLCEGLAAEGAAVVIADVGDPGVALSLIENVGGKGFAVDCNLGDETAINAMISETERRFGTCDILVHCAAHQPQMPFENIEVASWHQTISVNLDSLFHLSKAVIPGMKAKKWGRIVALTSATFYDGTPFVSQYVASKAGAIGLVRVLAKEMGRYGINVNALAPGLVRTANSEATVKRMKEIGEPDYYELQKEQQCIPRTLVPKDIVGPLLFLVSDRADAITGQSILVDGGWHHI